MHEENEIGWLYREEYKAMRQEMLQHIKQVRQVELYALIGPPTTFAWLVTHPMGTVPKQLICYLPSGIVLIAALECFFLVWRVSQMSHYLKTVERHFRDSRNPEGWETHVLRVHANRQIQFWAAIAWLAYLVLNLAFGWWVAHNFQWTVIPK